ILWSKALHGLDDYDADNMLDCLFKSYFLVWVGQHIFLGPSSALGGDAHTTCSCNAILHNMSIVEAEHIAYICMQGRFGVSSKSQWNELNGKLSYCKLYRSIVSFLRDPPDTEWRDKLLKWWNK
ncbi:hypothetical protein PAXRUDRAFT_177380, partial [Paxillus rubicundulus Ve08.2h10]